jgi:dienelactone hydrolase
MTPQALLRRRLLATGAALAGASLLASGCATAPATATASSVIVDDIRLPIDAQRELPLRVFHPRSGRRLPVVLFSHGAYSSGQDYDPLLRVWAAQGYVVLAPTHRDSTRLGVKRGSGDPRFFTWRLDDMEAIAAGLTAVVERVPALAGRLDATRIGATGHSFGGLVAQTLGGATYRDVGSGQTVSRLLANVRAVIVFSGAGIMEPLLSAADFASLTLPTLVTAGTEDLVQAPGLTGYEWRRQPYDLIPPGNKFLLTLEGADHYLGGAVGRDDLPRSPNAGRYVDAFNATSLPFLDWYLRDLRSGAAPLTAPNEPLARLDRR